MSATSLLTVALPTCNGARHLPGALRSVLAQDAAFDLLVCDDRSDDATPALVRQIAGDRARLVLNEQRLGLARNWNRCVELARTPWVAVFHQDDVMLEGHLANHLRAIHDRPDLGMIASGADVIDAEGQEVPVSVVDWPVIGDKNETFETGAFVRELAFFNPVRCSAVTLNRAAHHALGGFDPAYRYAVDWAFWLEIARVYPVAWCCHRTVAVRWHAASETHRFATGTLDLEEQTQVTDRALAWLAAQGAGDLPALRRQRDSRLARAYLNRAYTAACAGDRRLEVHCLRRAGPGVIGRLLTDPRLLARLAVGLTGRPRGVR